MYKVVGHIGTEVICKEFKEKKDAIAFMRRTAPRGQLHLQRPNKTWVNDNEIYKND